MTLAAGLVLTGIGSVPGAAAGSTCDNFTNAAGGAWTTGSNWSDSAPPTSAQNACIVLATTNPVTLQGATVTAGGLTLGTATTAGTLQLSSGTLDLNSGSVIGGLGVVKQVGGNSTISLASGATLANAGTISSVATLDLSGAVANTGTITSSAPLSHAVRQLRDHRRPRWDHRPAERGHAHQRRHRQRLQRDQFVLERQPHQ